MKVCYVWVKEFRNFKSIDLNLSSSHKFKYDELTNTLDLHYSKDLPEKFFGDQIEEITGIVGKNGSGKSNALELICKALKGGKSDIKNDFFVIIEEHGKLICYYNFTNKSHPKSIVDIFFIEHPGRINSLKVVFFSNVFDGRRSEFDKDIADISVNYLSRQLGYFPGKKLTDFEKQIKFINSKVFNSLEIELPSKVQITSKVWTNRSNNNYEKRFYSDNFDKVNDLKKFFRDRIRDLKPENKFIQLIKFGYFFDFYDLLTKNYGKKEMKTYYLIDDFNLFLNDLSIDKSTDYITDELIDFIEKKIIYLEPNEFDLFDYENSENEDLNGFNLFRKQINFIKEIKYFISIIDLNYNSEGSRGRGQDNFIINYKSNKSKGLINEFITLFESSTFIDVNWVGISSGHKAYLNLFSSIFNEIRFLRQPNLLLCIDEGDLYLHPKWQVEFFNKLLIVLPKIYNGNIQLILTSHSPFLLSDLPNQCITILDRNHKNSSFNGIELKIKTFGGNLYDLYSEPFFLGNQRTSDFAYSKIKDLIEKVENNEYTKNEKIELQKLLLIIGDEIIQYRLKNILGND